MNRTTIVKIFEMLPIFGFGWAYYRYDLHQATIYLTALSTLFVVVATVLGEKLNKLQWGTYICLLVLGSMTILFQNDQIIKWKTTIINSILATIFLLSHLTSKTISERLLGDIAKIQAPVSMLRKINIAAIFYFITVATLNLVFAYFFDTTSWVNFKIFGVFILNLIFLGGCAAYLWEYIKEHVEHMR